MLTCSERSGFSMCADDECWGMCKETCKDTCESGSSCSATGRIIFLKYCTLIYHIIERRNSLFRYTILSFKEKIMGICFNESGATMDRSISKDDLYLIVKALKLKEFADSQNNEAINVADRHAEANLIKLLESIHEHASKQDDRSIHIVVAEPVEYEYDD